MALVPLTDQVTVDWRKQLTLNLSNSHGNASAALPVSVRCGARQTVHGKSVWERKNSTDCLLQINEIGWRASRHLFVDSKPQLALSCYVLITNSVIKLVNSCNTLEGISLHRIVVETGNVSMKSLSPQNTAQMPASVFLRLKFDFVTWPINVKAPWTYSIHYIHISRMCPEAIVHWSKRRPRSLTVQRGQHHVRGVQGMNEVWRESSALFPCVRWNIG